MYVCFFEWLADLILYTWFKIFLEKSIELWRYLESQDIVCLDSAEKNQKR